MQQKQVNTRVHADILLLLQQVGSIQRLLLRPLWRLHRRWLPQPQAGCHLKVDGSSRWVTRVGAKTDQLRKRRVENTDSISADGGWDWSCCASSCFLWILWFILVVSLFLFISISFAQPPSSLSLPFLSPPLPLLSPPLCLSPVNLDLPCGRARAGWMGLCTQLSLPPFCLSWHNSLMSGRQTLRNCFCPRCRASLAAIPQILQITHPVSPSVLQWKSP